MSTGVRVRLIGGVCFAIGALSHLLAGATAACTLCALFWKRSRLGVLILPLGTAIGIGLYAYGDGRPIFEIGDGIAPGWLQLCSFAECSKREWFEVWGAAGLAGFLLVRLTVYRDQVVIALTLTGLYLLMNLPIWTTTGHMSYRLSASSLWIILLAFSFWVRERSQVAPRSATLALGLVVICWLATSAALSAKKYPDPFFSPDILKKHASSLQRVLPEGTFIRARHGLQFRISYYLKRPSAKEWPKETSFKHYYELTSIGGRKRCVAISKQTPPLPSCIQLGNGYALVARKSLSKDRLKAFSSDDH